MSDTMLNPCLTMRATSLRTTTCAAGCVNTTRRVSVAASRSFGTLDSQQNVTTAIETNNIEKASNKLQATHRNTPLNSPPEVESPCDS